MARMEFLFNSIYLFYFVLFFVLFLFLFLFAIQDFGQVSTSALLSLVINSRAIYISSFRSSLRELVY